MGTNCAPLLAALFLFCYERDFMISLSDDKQAGVISAFNTTSRYLDDILNINNVCNRPYAWWSTQSRLATLLPCLIARQWVGLQTL